MYRVVDEQGVLVIGGFSSYIDALSFIRRCGRTDTWRADTESAATRDSNYLMSHLKIQFELGKLSEKLLVNLHRFNSTSPDELDRQIAVIKEELGRLGKLYRAQHDKTVFNMSR